MEDIAAETDSTAPWHGLTPVPTTCTNNLHCKATHDCIVLAKYRRKPVALVIVSWPPFLRPPTLGRAFEEYRRVYQVGAVPFQSQILLSCSHACCAASRPTHADISMRGGAC